MVLTSKTTLLTKALGIGLAIALIATVITASPVWADDEGKAASPEAAQDESKEADPFKVPDGTPEELLGYIKGVLSERPESRDMASVMAFLKKSQNAVIEASEKILASSEATEQQCQLAVMAKLRGLLTLMRTQDPEAMKMLQAFPKQLEEMKKPELAKLVKSQLLSLEIQMAAAKVPGAKPLNEVVAEIETFVTENPNRSSVRLVMTTLSALGRKDKQTALGFCSKCSKLFAASDDPAALDIAKSLEGTARRLDLVGKPMKVVGKTLDGSEFDWASYKDKVVLVQFWATWCGPCRAELPSILEDYEKYHEKGFDVVGISLDRGLEPLEAFLKDDPLPWTIIYNGPRAEGEERGDLPNVTYYGVMGIPELILVGRDGNVIATGLRGKALSTALEKIFGASKEE